MHPSRNVAIIPARHASTRFPGKPLIDLDGSPMIVRVARQVERAERIERAVVATDDERIRAVCLEAGIGCVMTPSACASGTDRVAYAYRELGGGEGFDFVLNVQGDEPLIDPRDLDRVVACLEAHPEAIATLGRPLLPENLATPSVVKVVAAPDGRALYFSRAPMAGALQHVGVYGFSPAILDRFVSMEPSRLELAERLEQLRALEAGVPIYVALCASDRPSIAIDTPEDVAPVLRELRRAHGS